MTSFRVLALIASSLCLTACNDYREDPLKICEERDLQSGTCMKSHYVCTAPLTLHRIYGGVICSHPKDDELTPSTK